MVFYLKFRVGEWFLIFHFSSNHFLDTYFVNFGQGLSTFTIQYPFLLCMILKVNAQSFIFNYNPSVSLVLKN